MAVAIFSLTCGSALAQTTNTNTVTNGGTINVGVTEIITNTVTSPMSAAITNNGSLQFWQTTALTVSGAISGSGTVTKASGSGNLTLSGPNTFSGKVTVGAGTLIATGVADSGSSSLGTGTQLTLGGSATVSFTANSSNNTTRSLVLGGTGGNALKNSGSGALVWSGNVINNTTAIAADFTLGGSGTGGNEFSGLLTNNGANTMRLIKNETGTWKVSGANTFTGYMDVFNGTLQATTIANSGTPSSLGAGTTIRFGGWAGSAPVLEYVGSGSTNNKQFKLGGGGTANTGGTILNNGTGALVFNNATFNAAGDGTFSGTTRALTLGGTNAADNAISGVIGNNNAGASTNNTVSVVKDGAGKWILSGANTYTGGTTISNGTLQIGVGGTTGSVLGAITNNGTLILSRSGNPNFTNVISGSGPVLIASNASLTLSGASTFGGKVTAAGSSTLYAMSVADNGTSALGTNNQVELGSDPDSNKAALYVNVAAGTTNTTARELIANGPSFTLGNFSNGVLVWNGNTTFNRGTNSSFTFNLGANGTGTNVFAGMIGDTTQDEWETTAPVKVTVTSASIWSLTGSNTFSGGVTLNDGKLVVSSLATNGSIGSGNFRMGGFANVPVLEYVGSGDTNSKQMRLGAGPAATGGRILNNGTGALVFTNANFISGADTQTAGLDRAVIFGGTNMADNAITGVIANVNSTNTVSIIKDDAGKWVLSGSNTYSGTTTVNAGNLVIVRTNLTATILSNSVAVTFSPAPSAGTYTILPGALAANSLGSTSVDGLGNGQTATVVNSPNLVVQVADGPTGPSYEDTYSGIDPLAINPANGLSYLMNYALGGTGVGSNPALPVLTSSDTSLTLTANIRDGSQGVDVDGQYAYDLAGPWTDVVLTPTGASSSVANTTVQSFTQNVEAGRPKKFMRFKATKNP